jgi:hypothetical protein
MREVGLIYPEFAAVRDQLNRYLNSQEDGNRLRACLDSRYLCENSIFAKIYFGTKRQMTPAVFPRFPRAVMSPKIPRIQTTPTFAKIYFGENTIFA